MIILYDDFYQNDQASEEAAAELKESIYNFNDYDKILICADLGLWSGRRQAKKSFNNIDCVFRFCEDYNKFYFFNKKSALTLRATHHDGVNIFKFYIIKNNKKRALKYSDIYK